MRSLKRRAVVCVLSDFISETSFTRPLGVLARRHQVNAFVVHDPLEEAIPAGLGLIELEDAETGKRRLVDSSRLAPRVPPGCPAQGHPQDRCLGHSRQHRR